MVHSMLCAATWFNVLWISTPLVSENAAELVSWFYIDRHSWFISDLQTAFSHNLKHYVEKTLDLFLVSAVVVKSGGFNSDVVK